MHYVYSAELGCIAIRYTTQARNPHPTYLQAIPVIFIKVSVITLNIKLLGCIHCY